jgi:hypothetical protein
MATPKERFITKADLIQNLAADLNSTFQIGEPIWLWYSKDIHVNGVIAGVTFQQGYLISYDVAIPVAGTDLYIVSYGFRGGMSKPGDTWPGDDDGLVMKASMPTNVGTTQH